MKSQINYKFLALALSYFKTFSSLIDFSWLYRKQSNATDKENTQHVTAALAKEAKYVRNNALGFSNKAIVEEKRTIAFGRVLTTNIKTANTTRPSTASYNSHGHPTK